MPLSIVLSDNGGEFGDIARAVRSAGRAVVVRGETSSLKRALRMVRLARPNILLLGMGLPDSATFEAIQTANKSGKTRVVVMCHRDQTNDVVAALEAGATEHLFSDAQPADVIRVLTRAAAA